MPVPIILATAVDMKAPKTFKTAAKSTAAKGDKTLVETTVAMAFALSCHPLEKSKSRAKMMTNNNDVSNPNIFFVCPRTGSGKVFGYWLCGFREA